MGRYRSRRLRSTGLSNEGGLMIDAGMMADRVLRLRVRLHLSQSEFGAAVGVNQATVSRWEAGARAPRNSARVRIEELMEDQADDEIGTSPEV